MLGFFRGVFPNALKVRILVTFTFTFTFALPFTHHSSPLLQISSFNHQPILIIIVKTTHKLKLYLRSDYNARYTSYSHYLTCMRMCFKIFKNFSYQSYIDDNAPLLFYWLQVAPSAALTFLVYEECIKLLLNPVVPEGESVLDSFHNRLFSREGKSI